MKHHGPLNLCRVLYSIENNFTLFKVICIHFLFMLDVIVQVTSRENVVKPISSNAVVA